MKILWPAYIYPSPVWDEIIGIVTETGVDLTAIINPNSGPGGKGYPDHSYRQAITKMHTAHIPMVGYVHTSYGARDIRIIINEIEKWQNDYFSISGIFLDEVSVSTSKRPYYRDIIDAIHRRKMIVITNPGTQISESLGADIVVVFEGPLSRWHGVLSLNDTEMAAILYACPKSQIAKVIEDAKKNVTWLYVTDDVGPNPYDNIPSYFRELCTLIAAASVNKPEVVNKCGTCRWWIAAKGRCCRFPPLSRYWSRTSIEDWCGEWKKEESS